MGDSFLAKRLSQFEISNSEQNDLREWTKGRYSPLMAPKSPPPGVRSRDAGEYTCPDCGAVYKVTTFTSPFKNTGFKDCEVCNLHIKSWNHATAWWSYELTKRPKK